MRRVRIDDNGEAIEFVPIIFDQQNDPHYRIEIKVRDRAQLRRIYEQHDLVGIRMIGTPRGRAPQRSIIGPHHVEGLGLPER